MAHADNLHIQTQALDTILLITADGRIDGTTTLQLRLEIAEYGQLARAFILDLQNVSYISSTGLKLLLDLEKRDQEHAGTAVVCDRGQRSHQGDFLSLGVRQNYPHLR